MPSVLTLRSQTPARQGMRGLSLIEACVSLTLVGVLASLALPSLVDLMERRRLLGRADELAWELHHVRSQAILRNQRLRITFGQDSGGSCYVVHAGAARDCACSSDGTARCTAAGLMPVKSVSLPLGQGPQLVSNVGSMVVDPLLGTVSPAGTVRVIGRTGQEVRHVVSLTGRIRSCTTPRALSRHPSCAG